MKDYSCFLVHKVDEVLKINRYADLEFLYGKLGSLGLDKKLLEHENNLDNYLSYIVGFDIAGAFVSLIGDHKLNEYGKNCYDFLLGSEKEAIAE